MPCPVWVERMGVPDSLKTRASAMNIPTSSISAERKGALLRFQ